MRKAVLALTCAMILTSCGGAVEPGASPEGPGGTNRLDTGTVDDGVVLYNESGNIVLRPETAGTVQAGGSGQNGQAGGGGQTGGTGIPGNTNGVGSGAGSGAPSGSGTNGTTSGANETGGTTGSTGGSTGTGSAQLRSDAERLAEVVTAAVTCCDAPGSVPMDQRVRLIEDGEELRPLLERADEMFADPSGTRFFVEIERIVFPNLETRASYCQRWVRHDDCAEIESRVVTSTGVRAPRVWVLYAIRVNGEWQVSRRSACSLLTKISLRCPGSDGSELADWLSD